MPPIAQALCRCRGPAGRGMPSVTHRNLQPGCLESQCPWVCSCYGSRSLSRVAVGSRFASEASLSGGEVRILVTAVLSLKMAWFLCQLPAARECLQQQWDLAI